MVISLSTKAGVNSVTGAPLFRRAAAASQDTAWARCPSFQQCHTAPQIRYHLLMQQSR